jgi:hypothetical protein
MYILGLCRINSISMWCLGYGFKVYFKIAEKLMKIKGQSKCITWSINIAGDQVYSAVIKQVENP